jgi:hypothetical protein
MNTIDPSRSLDRPWAVPPSKFAFKVNMDKAIRAASDTVLKVGSGSGVIVGRKGNDYYVLTNAHVLDPIWRTADVVLPDGKKVAAKTAKMGSGAFGPGLDLAIVVVSASPSSKPFSVAKVGTVGSELGSAALQAGFPTAATAPGSVLNSNGRQGRYLVSSITEVKGNALEGGYALGIGKNLGVGCSGGGIFDAKGVLIGISGRAQKGMIPMRLNDGGISRPESENTAGWSIPSHEIRKFCRGIIPGY